MLDCLILLRSPKLYSFSAFSFLISFGWAIFFNFFLNFFVISNHSTPREFFISVILLFSSRISTSFLIVLISLLIFPGCIFVKTIAFFIKEASAFIKKLVLYKKEASLKFLSANSSTGTISCSMSVECFYLDDGSFLVSFDKCIYPCVL